MAIDIVELWSKSLSKIAEKVGNSTFELWLKPIKMVSMKDRVVTLEIPNRFFREWLEEYYPDMISEVIESIILFPVDIKYQIAEKEDENLKKLDLSLEQRKTRLSTRGIHLNPKYTFDSFVSGPSNSFAHAAAMRVAENPGNVYNPLFIYGGVGLGKTHLINAIGNVIIDKHPTDIVFYVSAEQFTNEVVAAIRHGKMEYLKEKYRNLDVLLIDDIQFIKNKNQTQEEFFHTFNSLFEKQKQIVLTSDRPPLEISDITDRLRSRFSMGLIADIQAPEVETKIAIILKKAEKDNMDVPLEVASFIAAKLKSNNGIRDLEGCLIKLGAHSSISGMPIDLNMAKNVLKDLISEEDKPVTIDTVQKAVSECFEVKIQDIKGKKRTKEIANARQISMYLAKELTQHSLSEIGKHHGGKDHATVIYACKQIKERRETDKAIDKLIENLIKRVLS